MSEICGRKPHTPFLSYDRSSRTWRTLQVCLLTNTLDEYSETWPKAGITVGGDAFPQPNWERRIGAIDGGLWPTPTARDYRSPHAKGSKAFIERQTHSRGVSLVEEMQRRGSRGKLNPNWVEWLMNWPIGWTSLDSLPVKQFESWKTDSEWWDQEPPIPRVAIGVKNRVNRLKALGNGQVSICAATAWNLLTSD